MTEQHTTEPGPASHSVPSTPGAVTVTGLTKAYDDVVAVADLDLAIKPGELLVLLGPSGCGKTTTLRTIAGLEHATEGTVYFDNADVTRQAPQRRDVAMVFQSYALYPHKTVRGNLRFPLRKVDISEATATERIEEVTALLEMEEKLDTRPAQLSGGQRQRVAVGRALVRQPHLLCMDEPLSNLDAKLRVETRAELRQLQQRLDITTLYVTHDQEEAMSIADRIAVMNGGHIEQIGTPKEIYEHPANEFVASFIGDPSMNMLDPADLSRAEVDLPTGSLADPATVGIRPEHIYPATADDKPSTEEQSEVQHWSDTVVFNVELVEPVGRAYEVLLSRESFSLTARLRTLPEGVREGVSATFILDRDRLMCFDATGEVMDL